MTAILLRMFSIALSADVIKIIEIILLWLTFVFSAFVWNILEEQNHCIFRNMVKP